ncbi:2OG-Fe(II) oxygenase family protein [Hoeflea sp. CAU 1731]
MMKLSGPYHLPQFLDQQIAALFQGGEIPAFDFSKPAGEPALAPASSVSWVVFKNSVSLFIGGIAAVIMEFALPGVRSVVWDHYSAASGNPGFIPMKGESLDPTKAPDLKEAFNIGLELPADDPEIVSGARFRALNLWPEAPGFKDTMLDFYNAVWSLGKTLHSAFATELGIESDFFDDKLSRSLATLRLLRYPPRPAALDEGQLGAGEHTDYECVTLLATDEVGGREVHSRDGRWLAAPYIPDTFVCNIGDCLMRWTNDVYVSTPHRVVSPPNRERYSVAFFMGPNPEAIVECLPGCATDETPAKYTPIRGDDYLESRLNPTYEKSGQVS